MSYYFFQNKKNKGNVIYMKKLQIIISGLDNAGKTSILTAFDKRYDFEEEILELTPTKKVEYHRTQFLDKSIYFWDMGGQKKYRKIYEKNPDSYFSGTNLLIYIIDIQDNVRFEMSLEYLNKILQYFKKNEMVVPIIVAFHKLDPELKDDVEILKNVGILTEKIINIEQLKKLFLQTSIYDIISIVQLISTALSIFEEKYSELKELFENYLKVFDCESLILFDKNGVIISDAYTASLDFDSYILLIKSIKEHIIRLKKIQEENYEHDYNFNPVDKDVVSYLHRIKLKDKIFYVSVSINENTKEDLRNKISGFITGLNNLLESILS